MTTDELRMMWKRMDMAERKRKANRRATWILSGMALGLLGIIVYVVGSFLSAWR